MFKMNFCIWPFCDSGEKIQKMSQMLLYANLMNLGDALQERIKKQFSNSIECNKLKQRRTRLGQLWEPPRYLSMVANLMYVL